MAKELDLVSLLDVFPPSIREDPNVQANAAAFDPEFHLLAKDVKEVLLYPRLDELPEPILDLLAWERHVDFYELAKTVEAKREVIRGAPAWHRKKGTVWAILKAMEMFGVKGTFTNWYEMEPRGRPGTFAVDAELTDEYWKRSDWNAPVSVVYRAIVESKAARSLLGKLHPHIDREAECDIFVGASVAMGRHQSILMPSPKSGATVAVPKAGASVAMGRHQSVLMPSPKSGATATVPRAGVSIAVGRHQSVLVASPTSGAVAADIGAGVSCGVGIHIALNFN